MGEFGHHRVSRFSLVAFSFLLSVGLSGPATAQQEKTAQPALAPQEKPVPPAPGEAAYAGPAACETCHEDVYQGWEKSAHWKTMLDSKTGPSRHGCEACHGAGAAHVADPSDTSKLFLFEKASTKEINARCLSCHASGTQHMNAVNSEHSKNGVSCVSCHSPHHAEAKEFLLKKSQPELCFGCHLQQKSQFEMPFHHRVNEGLVQCSDCHNVHGTVKPKQVRTSSTQNAVCLDCHREKEGPFVFEHPPVRTEGCQSCHVPHGGANQHMLKVSNVNLLCLQCHTNSTFSAATNTPSFHNQQSNFQACTLCHVQIHGSNFDHFFFK
jgi:DmsE family decaheme c-type cytochrome